MAAAEVGLRATASNVYYQSGDIRSASSVRNP